VAAGRERRRPLPDRFPGRRDFTLGGRRRRDAGNSEAGFDGSNGVGSGRRIGRQAAIQPESLTSGGDGLLIAALSRMWRRLSSAAAHARACATGWRASADVNLETDGPAPAASRRAA